MSKGGPQTEEAFRIEYEYSPAPKRKFLDYFKEECLCSKETIFNLFPILRWLPKYKVREYLLGDIISGITVAVMHIPHGLAYSQLGNVPPVVGLYMAFFPLLIYVLMASSRHASLGTFAVLCAMVGDIVVMYENHTAIDVAICVCLMVGIWQIAFSLLRMGVLITFFSNALVSGFTTGAAMHVLAYQFKNLLGIHLSRFRGPLKLIYLYKDLFQKITTTNLVTMAISISFSTALLIYNYGFKPLLQKKFPKCRVPIPVELIAVVLGILLSYFMELNENYNVDIVGPLPTGFPTPKVPEASLIYEVILLSFPVAIVAVSVNLSLATILARKSGYVISSRQEILAYGAANVFSCFFQCMPSAASLSRTVIQYSSGGKTQLAAVFSMIVIIFILSFMGPIFTPVPYCVLSSIVIATIAGLLLQILELPRLFRQSYLDGLVWLITFLAVVIIDIDYGLLAGFIASVLAIIIFNHKPQVLSLGRVSGGPMYLDISNFGKAHEVNNIVAIKVIGNMSFANNRRFQKQINAFCDKKTVFPNEKYPPAIVLDMSGVSAIDPTAAEGLLQINTDLKRKNFGLFLANCNVAVYSALEKYEFFKNFNRDFVMATVNDAVLLAMMMQKDTEG